MGVFPNLCSPSSRARARFATGNSDILTDVNAYEECANLREKRASRVRAFCEDVRRSVLYEHLVAMAYTSAELYLDVNDPRHSFSPTRVPLHSRLAQPRPAGQHALLSLAQHT